MGEVATGDEPPHAEGEQENEVMVRCVIAVPRAKAEAVGHFLVMGCLDAQKQGDMELAQALWDMAVAVRDAAKGDGAEGD